MGMIKETFDSLFEEWEVELPHGSVEDRLPGALQQTDGSGLIRYAFGSDQRGTYLEFYSFHRIAGDGHARIYEDGEIEDLPTLQTMVLLSDDPEENERREAAMHENNRQLLADLEEKGLMSGGPVPGAFQVNAYLTTGKPDLGEQDDEEFE